MVRFIQNRYTDQYDPSYYDDYRRNIEFDGRVFELDILDTC